jgi:hypothetical protein
MKFNNKELTRIVEAVLPSTQSKKTIRTMENMLEPTMQELFKIHDSSLEQKEKIKQIMSLIYRLPFSFVKDGTLEFVPASGIIFAGQGSLATGIINMAFYYTYFGANEATILRFVEGLCQKFEPNQTNYYSNLSAKVHRLFVESLDSERLLLP